MVKKRKKASVSSALFLWTIFVSLVGCSTSVTPIEPGNFQPEDDEVRLWKQSQELQARFDRSGLVYEDEIVTEYVNRVGSSVIPKNFSQQVKFSVKVLKHPVPNAFALPHGAFYIHSGMLGRMTNEAQLASVIGHEVSHITHRHTLQTFRSVKQAAAFGSTLQIIAAPAGIYGTAAVLLGALGTLAAVSGYSQALEEEADIQGLRLMVNAGYDPREAVKVIENVKTYVEQDEIKEPFFFSTHPRLEERKASYQRLLETDYSGVTGKRGEEDFATIIARVRIENAQLELARGRYAFAQQSIEQCLDMDPHNSRAHFTLGEIHRQRGQEGDHAKAETAYLRAIELSPAFAEPHRGIALIYLKSARPESAKEQFQKYLELKPNAQDRPYIENYLRGIGPGKVQP